MLGIKKRQGTGTFTWHDHLYEVTQAAEGFTWSHSTTHGNRQGTEGTAVIAHQAAVKSLRERHGWLG